MTKVRFETNDLASRDPDRAATIEDAIREGLLENPEPGEMSCSVYIVGWEPKLLRVELRGEGWYENLPLFPIDVAPATVRLLSRCLVVRRES